jgi:hypothetical protein
MTIPHLLAQLAALDALKALMDANAAAPREDAGRRAVVRRTSLTVTHGEWTV